MKRIAVWSVIVVLAILGRVLDDARFTATIAPIVIVALWFGAPRALRAAVALAASALLGAWLYGGIAMLVDVLPIVIAALVGWLFARSLLRGRQPLIARAIAVMEGNEPLADAGVRRYAMRLTAFWAACQYTLAAFGLVCVAHAHGGLADVRLPTPGMFGALVLPVTVIFLLVAEFSLRPYLLPQAPRQNLLGFVRSLARAWPQLIEE